MANQQDTSKNHNPAGHNQHTQANPSNPAQKGNRAGAQDNGRQQDQSAGTSGRSQSGGGTQGGTHEQHVNAGKQSHKNS